MKKPVIGISSNWAKYHKGRPDTPDNPHSYVQNVYVEAVAKAGGLPFIIPTLDDYTLIPEMLSHVDALVMTGGGDLDPKLWNAPFYSDKNQYVRPFRDKWEIELFKQASMPILGICRGHQLIAVTLGGSMYQDLTEIPLETLPHGEYFDHRKRSDGSLPHHGVAIDPDSHLGVILEEKKIYNSNSAHHQVVSKVPKGFRAVGWCEYDGLIEAMEGMWNRHKVICVQWHPEHMLGDEGSENLFVWIVQSAIENMQSK